MSSWLIAILIILSLDPQIMRRAGRVVSGPPDPSIAKIGVGTVGNADGADITPTIPAAATTGDLMMVLVHQRDRVASSVTGWTLLDTEATSATNKLGIWYKFHDGTEANPTVTHGAGSSICGYVAVFRNVEADDPIDTLGPYVDQSTDPGPNTFVQTQTTTQTDSTMVIHLGGAEDNNAWESQTGKCDSLLATYSNGSGTDNSIYICWGRQAAAGATGTSSITQGSLGWDNGISVHFALKMNR